MRKTLLCLSLMGLAHTMSAQTISTFESLSLPKADTAYINYSSPGTDVGFKDGLAYFPCVYDTSSGYEFWESGFAYSNMTDTVTSGYLNQYSAKTGIGYAASSNYVVASGAHNVIRLTDSATNKSVFGFYVTNSTYAYNSMRDGDFVARKFNATDSDWFRLDVFAYRKDTLSSDSVSFYLADFRNTDSSAHYIVNDWQWVDLLKLGHADSLYFRLQSSDTGIYGMNTPAYFCMDNLITNESGLSIKQTAVKADLKIYPNPASNKLYISSSIASEQYVSIYDLTGKSLGQYILSHQQLEIDLSAYPSGTYILNFRNGQQISSTKFIKQ